MFKFLNANPHFSDYFSYLCILIFFLIYIPPNGSLNGDEEMYFRSALENFQDNNTYLNYRFIYDYIVYYLINQFGYELTQIIGRLLVITFYILGFSFLVKSFKISLPKLFLIILIFCVSGQSFFGQFQIIKGFLSADIASIFTLFSISHVVKRNFLYSIVFAISSTYLHFIIGGYTSIFILCLILMDSLSAKKKIKFISLYILAILPILTLLFLNNSMTNQIPIFDYLYSQRHIHHLLPFKSFKIFFNNWFFGLVIMILSNILLLIYKKNLKLMEEKMAFKMLICINIYLIFAFVISYLDKDYIFAKFYLFRANSFSLLLTIIFLVVIFFKKFSFFEKIINGNTMILSLILSVFIFQNKIVERISPSINYNKLVLYNHVIQNTNKSSKFLIKKGMLDFERKTNRKSLFHNKFVPSQSLKMMEWYENRKIYQEAFDQFKYDSKIDFLISDQKIEKNEFITLVFSNETYKLYKINK